jgi:adenylyltransferase/sulfurtransferase
VYNFLLIVVGTIGVMQALQTIKVILELPGILSGRLLLFDGMDMTFKNLKLRSKNQNCDVCSHNSTIKTLIDYEQFCGSKANDKNPNLKILNENERISANEYNQLMHISQKPFILVDVRSNEEYEMCHLKNSINIPFSTLKRKSSLNSLKKEMDKNGSDVSNGDF